MNDLKKNIIICSHALEIGGAERALLDMLHCIDYSRFHVDLFLYRHEGEWFNQIPAQVHLLPEIPQYACLAVPIKQAVKRKQFGVFLGRVIGKVLAAQYDKMHPDHDSAVALEYSHKYTQYFMPRIQSRKVYDLAISFLTPHYFAAGKIRAKKKIAWIHTDYKAIHVNKESERKMWGKYDAVASISDSCTESFLSVFPDLKEKIISIENVLAKDMVYSRASQDVSDEMPKLEDTWNLLSIGRFSYAKKLEDVPALCRRLIDAGQKVHWYLIGYGPDETLIRENIARYEVEKCVTILGKRENPYPYIAACDVYVQPSRYEGKAVTVREAQMLGKPVIITAFETAESQLLNGYDGIIVPMDVDGCAKTIAALLEEKVKLDTITDNVKKEDYSNRKELNKLYHFIEEA